MKCPYCRDEIIVGTQYSCPSCHTPHHKECWQQNNGCTVWGCAQAPGDDETIIIGAEGHVTGGPGSPSVPHPHPSGRVGSSYLIDRSGTRMGPYSLDEAQRFFAQGLLLPGDLAWTEGMADWLPLAEVIWSGRRVPPPPLTSQMATNPSASNEVSPANKPKTYMREAIVATLCCCVPFGIPAIVYAAQVDSKYKSGDYQGAQRASDNAKTWYYNALISGLVVGFIWFIANFANH